MTLLTTHNPIRPLPAGTAQELMRMFIDQDTDALLVGACLALMAQRDPTGEELHAFAATLLAEATPFPAVPFPAVDTCGTGGDGASTANLSTLSALLLAHLGVPVVKHGNRAATSRCGSADLLEALGYPLMRAAQDLHADVQTRRFAFLFAPAYHPLLGRLREIRTRLGIPTIFNLLGPLLNPARPRLQVLGVARESLLQPMAQALAMQGVQRAFVVHGKCAHGRGIDEPSTEGPTIVMEVNAGRVQPAQVLVPRDLGVPIPARDALQVRDRDHAMAVARGCLQGAHAEAFSAAIADAVALQAGLGLLLHRQAPLSDLVPALQEGRRALEAGFDPAPLLQPT